MLLTPETAEVAERFADGQLVLLRWGGKTALRPHVPANVRSRLRIEVVVGHRTAVRDGVVAAATAEEAFRVAVRPWLAERLTESRAALVSPKIAEEVGVVAMTIKSDDSGLRNRVAILSGTLGVVEETTARLRRELAEERIRSRVTTSELRARVATLEAELASAQAYVRTLQAQATALEAELASAQAYVRTLQAQATALEAELASAQAYVRTQQEQIQTAMAATETQQARATTLEAELASAQASMRTLQEQIQTATAATETQQAHAMALEAELASAQASMRTLQEQIQSAVAATETQEAHTRGLEAELVEAHQRLEEAALQRRQLEASIAQRSREVEDWQAAHDSARTGLEYYRSEFLRWQGSRLWRYGSVYWAWRARLSRVTIVTAMWHLGKRILRPLRRRPAAAPPQLAQPATAPPPPAQPAAPDPASRPVSSIAEIQAPHLRTPVEAPSPLLPDGFPAIPAGHYDVVVFSIIDWDFRFQRPQQIATQFARHGHRVLFLSTTAWLPPDGKAWELTRKTRNVCELKLRTPRALDIYGGKLCEEDLEALEQSLTELTVDLGIADAISLVQIPFWTPLAKRLAASLGWRVVYDCMDEWTNFPGFGDDVLQLEAELVRDADVTVVSADRLMTKHERTAHRIVLARNGVDLVHYEKIYGPNTLLGEVKHPVIGYYGALASWVDVPLLEKIADTYPDATIVLAGGHFDVDLEPIASRPNVRLLGQRPYFEMPQLLWNFDACVIPFLVNDITQATNPVKFYEYCWGGKPVVAPRLTELLPYKELCYLADNHKEFLAGLADALKEARDDPRRERRRQVARDNDWRERYRAIDAAVNAAYPLVSVVIVTFGGLELTKACLASLLGQETWPHLEVIVVDNGSLDDTVPYVESLAAADPRVRVVANGSNFGFAAGNNKGLAIATGDIFVLLNNDTVVPPGLLARMVAHLQRSAAIGLLCPTTNFAGNEAKVDPEYADLSGLPAFAARRGRQQAGRYFDIRVAAMYCVAMHRHVWEQVGPLDEAYGIGMFEDDDYAVRMRQAGLRVVCAEDAYVHHVGQGAFAKLSPQDYDRLWARNQAYYERKFGVVWQRHAPREAVSPVESKIGANGS